MILAAALYVILRPAGRGIALFAAFSRLTYAFLWFITLLDCFAAARYLSGASYLHVFEPNRIEALAALQLASAWDSYYLGLTFYGLGTLFFSYLWLKSRYIPRMLAAFGVLTSFFVILRAGVLAFPQLRERHLAELVRDSDRVIRTRDQLLASIQGPETI